MDVHPTKQVAETQSSKETAAIADTIKSLEASESTEEQVNQPQTADSEMVLDQNFQEEVKDTGLESIGDVNFEQIIDEYDQKNKAAREELESPYDTEFKIKIIKRFQLNQLADEAHIVFLGFEPNDIKIDQTKSMKLADFNETNCGLPSMPDDDLVSLLGFEADDSNEEGSQSNNLDNLSKKDTAATLHAFDDMPAQCLRTIKKLVLESIEEKLPLFDEQVQQSLQDQLPSMVVEPMNKQFHAFNILESRRFVTLYKELSKVIQNKMGVTIKKKVCKEMEAVSNKLASIQSTVATNSKHVWDLRLMFKDMVLLLEEAKFFRKANGEGGVGEKQPETPTEEKDAPNLDQPQGEQHSGDATLANA
nr:hypothetical protein [Tanacetum cinerariifolium]